MTPAAGRPMLSVMSVRFIFRCQFCDAQPDPLTQVNLEKAMRENTWGAYQDAMPGKWLVFHGRGLYRPASGATNHATTGVPRRTWQPRAAGPRSTHIADDRLGRCFRGSGGVADVA